jgi:V/A-type H+-transporting ATPase subunit I
MAIVEMEKLRLYVHKSVSTGVLRTIQKLGVFEFTEIKDVQKLEQAEKSVFEFNYVSSRLDFAIEFLSKWEDRGKRAERIKRAIEGNRVFTTDEEIEEAANTFYFNDIIDGVQDIEEKINDTNAKLKDLNAENILLQGWEMLEITLSTPLETSTTKTILLTGNKDNMNKLSSALKSTKTLHDIKNLDDKHFAITTFKKDIESISKKFSEYELELVELPKRRGTPAEEIERIERAIIKNEKTRSELEEQAKTLAKNLPKLKMVGDYMFWKKEKHNILSSAHMKNDVLIFEGWCPKTQTKRLKDTIYKITKLFVLESTIPKKEERPPIEIKNSKAVTPFEAITRLYGLPGSKDIDPTPFLAGFFFIFFGLSLTDVGYGLFLLLATAIPLLFFRIPKGTKPLLQLLMLGGLSSVFVGLLFGGYFGINMEYMPDWLQTIQKFDPIANPLPVFYMALGFGVLQIMFGLILKIVRDKRNGEFVNGLLDQGPWLALFSSLIFWGAAKIGIISGYADISVLTIYASLIFLVLTQGRKEVGVIKKLFKGIFSLYDSINFFSDVLSYSRLLALGLATSALAFAVNLIAVMVGDMIPYVGTVFMVIILIIGHLFNLAVNTLGAFIHSARLQFVEFFGKFITDNGKAFTPFKREERYVVIK